MEMRETLIVWRRTGKEHRENAGFQRNSPDVVEASLRAKVEDFRSVATDTGHGGRSTTNC